MVWKGKDFWTCPLHSILAFDMLHLSGKPFPPKISIPTFSWNLIPQKKLGESPFDGDQDEQPAMQVERVWVPLGSVTRAWAKQLRDAFQGWCLLSMTKLMFQIPLKVLKIKIWRLFISSKSRKLWSSQLNFMIEAELIKLVSWLASY